MNLVRHALDQTQINVIIVILGSSIFMRTNVMRLALKGMSNGKMNNAVIVKEIVILILNPVTKRTGSIVSATKPNA